MISGSSWGCGWILASARPGTIHTCCVGAALGTSGERPQQLHHLEIIRIRRGVVVCYLVVLLRRLQNQRNIQTPRIVHQPTERPRSDASVPNEHMPILVGAKSPFTVVQVEEGR